jgi:hypothetical protein
MQFVNKSEGGNKRAVCGVTATNIRRMGLHSDSKSLELKTMMQGKRFGSQRRAQVGRM